MKPTALMVRPVVLIMAMIVSNFKFMTVLLSFYFFINITKIIKNEKTSVLLIL